MLIYNSSFKCMLATVIIVFLSVTTLFAQRKTDQHKSMSTQDSVLYEKRKAFFVAAFKEQREMNKKSYQTYLKKKAEMDSTYRSVLSEYSKDTIFIRKMKDSQFAWEKSMEADMEAIFPMVKTDPMYYGDIQPMCDYDLRSAFVARRTAFLKQ